MQSTAMIYIYINKKKKELKKIKKKKSSRKNARAEWLSNNSGSMCLYTHPSKNVFKSYIIKAENTWSDEVSERALNICRNF